MSCSARATSVVRAFAIGPARSPKTYSPGVARFPFELIRPREAFLGAAVYYFGEAELRWSLGIDIESFDHGVPLIDEPGVRFTEVYGPLELEAMQLRVDDWRALSGRVVPDKGSTGSLYIHSMHQGCWARWLRFRPSATHDWTVDVKVRFDFGGSKFRAGSVELRGIPCRYGGLISYSKTDSPGARKRAHARARKVACLDAHEEPKPIGMGLKFEPKR